jgi:hypothetical protein
MLRQEIDQYVFVIRFDKDKIVKGSKFLIQDKWNLIANFIKSQIVLVDPERLQSVTVMMPNFSTKNDIKYKKVKLLITLFLLMISDNYFLCQKSNGYIALPREGHHERIFKAKSAISKFYLRSKFTMRKLISQTKSSADSYTFQALDKLPGYTDATPYFMPGNLPQIVSRDSMSIVHTSRRLANHIVSSPGHSPTVGISSARRIMKRKTTRVDVHQLMQMFNIEDDGKESDHESELSQSNKKNDDEEAIPGQLISPTIVGDSSYDHSHFNFKNQSSSRNFGHLLSKRGSDNQESGQTILSNKLDSMKSIGEDYSKVKASPFDLLRPTKRSAFDRRRRTRMQVNTYLKSSLEMPDSIML